jgi:hypothetical protein
MMEAVGSCGLTFPNGDVTALAGRIEMVLADHSLEPRLLEGVERHLAGTDPHLWLVVT